jgi:hypothetical protein
MLCMVINQCTTTIDISGTNVLHERYPEVRFYIGLLKAE